MITIWVLSLYTPSSLLFAYILHHSSSCLSISLTYNSDTAKTQQFYLTKQFISTQQRLYYYVSAIQYCTYRGIERERTRQQYIHLQCLNLQSTQFIKIPLVEEEMRTSLRYVSDKCSINTNKIILQQPLQTRIFYRRFIVNVVLDDEECLRLCVGVEELSLCRFIFSIFLISFPFFAAAKQ